MKRDGSMVVLGAKISYFTGKFEAYLRYKEIPYRYRALDLLHYYWIVPRKLGASQYPTVRLADGRWMSDSTPMIAWLERMHPRAPVMPDDPAARFVALLIEDYADEWLWRPAMHYRWSYAADRQLAGSWLAREVVRMPMPVGARRAIVARRQTALFVTGDGIDASTREHAERSYHRVLECVEPVFEARPFVLGERPTIADIGLMGPFWRHFVHDPTPASVMRERAPASYRWSSRMWNARASGLAMRPLADGVPDDLSPLLREIGETHLEALAVNAVAHAQQARHHELPIQGTTYHRVPTSPYRVWCLEQLRARYRELGPADAERVRALLESDGCWEPLWRVGELRSGHDPLGEAPFCRALRMVRD